jgi:hypothetical protein
MKATAAPPVEDYFASLPDGSGLFVSNCFSSFRFKPFLVFVLKTVSLHRDAGAV